MTNPKLLALSKGRTGKLLIELLKEVQSSVADIRTPLSVKPEIENQVRLAVCECLDIYFIEPLKVLNSELESPNPDEHI